MNHKERSGQDIVDSRKNMSCVTVGGQGLYRFPFPLTTFLRSGKKKKKKEIYFTTKRVFIRHS